jgi:hypothetical protein
MAILREYLQFLEAQEVRFTRPDASTVSFVELTVNSLEFNASIHFAQSIELTIKPTSFPCVDLPKQLIRSKSLAQFNYNKAGTFTTQIEVTVPGVLGLLNALGKSISNFEKALMEKKTDIEEFLQRPDMYHMSNEKFKSYAVLNHLPRNNLLIEMDDKEYSRITYEEADWGNIKVLYMQSDDSDGGMILELYLIESSQVNKAKLLKKEIFASENFNLVQTLKKFVGKTVYYYFQSKATNSSSSHASNLPFS